MRGFYRFLVSITAIALLTTLTYAQQIKYTDGWGPHGFSIIEDDGNTIKINYSLAEILMEEIEIDGEEQKAVKVPGIFLPNEEGFPDLAGTGKYVAIPQGANVSYTILSSRTETIKNINIAPSPQIPLDTEDGPLHYEKNSRVYSTNSFYPSENIKLKKSKIRGVDVVMVGITPFQYNPVTRELVIYKDLQIELKISGGNGIIGDSRLRSRWWDPIIYNAVLNPNSIPKIDYSVKPKSSKSPDYEYLIIVPDDPVFLSWADSIKLFRTLQGIKTGIVTTTDIGGNTVSNIESYVDDAYNIWDVAPSAVLLLGDYGTSTSGINSQIYVHPASYPDFVSDNKFADVDEDNLPDIAFARITANDAAQLEVMITKFLDYERNPPTNPDFYDHPITALGWQTERWFQICSEVAGGYFKNVLGKNPVRINAIYSGTPGSVWSTAINTSTVVNYFGPSGLGYIPATPAELGGWSGGSASDVVNAINAGSFLLQHRDHGYYEGWGEPAFSSSNINSLTNINNQLPYIFSINCQTGAFHRSSETFTEKFHRYTYGGQNSGALGVMAATEVSYSFVNDTYLWGVMDNLFPDFMPAETAEFPVNYVMPAFGNAAGKHFLYQSSWPYNTSNKLITYRLFHHHGDAFMTVYSEVPQSLSITHDAVLLAGAESFAVTADAGSFIALTVNEEIIGTADGTGSSVVISIPPQNPDDVMIVTVTKQNYYRYSSSVDVIADGIFAQFSADETEACTGNSIQFTDMSFGTITSWNWSFPGGTPGSHTGQNPPPIIYNSAGSYDVSLSVSDGVDSDIEYKTNYMIISDVVADFSASINNVIIGNTVTFTDNSSCFPTSWSWSFPGGSPASATGIGPHTVTYNTTGTYNVSLEVSNSYGTDTETKTDYIDVTDCSICPSSGSNASMEWIGNVTFNTIDNSSGGSVGYQDFTSLSTDVNPGSNYNLSVTCDQTGSWTEHIWVFFDWNRDCDFNDAGESFDLGQIATPGSLNLNIPIPQNASIGATTMRVSLKYNGDPGPCENFSYGQVEDYSVNVLGTMIDIKIFLEGPFNTTEMNTALNIGGFIPLNQPYNTSPWNYFGGESVTTIPNSNVVDWILLELRETPGDVTTAIPGTKITAKAGFILKNGSIVDIDGSSPIRFDVIINDNLYAIVYHRNHLGIMSAYPLSIIGDSYVYDFTTSIGQAYGGINAHSEIAPGIWGMIAGDANADGEIDNQDKNDNWKAQMGLSGFYSGDFDMSGQVETIDKTIKWKPNSGSCSFIIK